jgi:hypothetical protein
LRGSHCFRRQPSSVGCPPPLPSSNPLSVHRQSSGGYLAMRTGARLLGMSIHHTGTSEHGHLTLLPPPSPPLRYSCKAIARHCASALLGGIHLKFELEVNRRCALILLPPTDMLHTLLARVTALVHTVLPVDNQTTLQYALEPPPSDAISNHRHHAWFFLVAEISGFRNCSGRKRRFRRYLELCVLVIEGGTARLQLNSKTYVK